jgi:hypothetical protein
MFGEHCFAISGVALERAAGHARDAGVAVRWVHAGLAEAVLPPASFDLVSAQYPALLRTSDAAGERALVAPGGVLLLVHHAGMDTQQVHGSGFDLAYYVVTVGQWQPGGLQNQSRDSRCRRHGERLLPALPDQAVFESRRALRIETVINAP